MYMYGIGAGDEVCISYLPESSLLQSAPHDNNDNSNDNNNNNSYKKEYIYIYICIHMLYM